MIKVNIPEKYKGTEIEKKMLEIISNFKKKNFGIVIPHLPEGEEQFTLEFVDEDAQA